MCLIQTLKDNRVFVKYQNYIYGFKSFDLKNGDLYSRTFDYKYKFNKRYWTEEDPKSQRIERRINTIDEYSKSYRWIIDRIETMGYHIRSFNLKNSGEYNNITYYNEDEFKNKTQFNLILLLVKTSIEYIEEVGDEDIITRKFNVITNKDEFNKVMSLIDKWSVV